MVDCLSTENVYTTLLNKVVKIIMHLGLGFELKGHVWAPVLALSPRRNIIEEG